MARSIPTDALARLAEKHGVESILIVSIQWALNGSWQMYADREIDGQEAVKPAILELGTFDSVLAVSLNESSQEVSITLDDTDGTIKDILDHNDIHKRDVVIYQWFADIPFDSKFVVFRGKINSPINWKESDRTVSFSVLSQLEDNEVGFTPEEGEFTDDTMEDMLGKTWPECFGTSVHQKVIKVDNVHQGSLGDSFGIADFTLPARMAALGAMDAWLLGIQAYWALVEGFLRLIDAETAADAAHQKQLNIVGQLIGIRQQYAEVSENYAEQKATERSSFKVVNGDKFPRGTLTLNINDALVTGSFGGDGDIFYATHFEHPEEKNFPPKVMPYAESYGIGTWYGAVVVYTGKIGGEQAGAFNAEVGSSVTIASNEPIRYIVSITPGTGGPHGNGVLKCAAFTTFKSGERVLMDIPTNYWTCYRQSFGSVTATIVEMHDAISKKEPQPWEDTVYVTFRSTVGPNTVDIMAYLISRYTSFSMDTASFNSVRARVNNYPMHFVFPGRKNIFTALQELAFQSRCAIFLHNGVFYLKYLPAQPTSVHTFDESNVDTNSLELGFTETEDLITKFVGTWKAHGAVEDDYKCILRYNVKKYGLHDFEFDFYAYNHLDMVIKTMTYWIIRRGNTWKTLSFDASLDALNAETFDGATLDFTSDYASNSSVLGIVEQADYDSEKNTIAFKVWTGVRAGEMDAYDFAYPGDVSQTLIFPDPIEEASGFAGGGGVGQNAGGALLRSGPTGGISVNYEGGDDDPHGNKSNDRRNSDKGGKNPSDAGDNHPGSPQPTDTGEVNEHPEPPPSRELTDPNLPEGEDPFYIDIRTTEVTDSANPGPAATFDTFFKRVKEGVLQGDTTATWADDSNEGTFDFKWDAEDEEWGAGTAFLEE